MNNQPKVYNLLISIFRKLEKRRKFQVFLFFIIISFSAILETFNLATALPFLNIITNPENSINNNILEKLLNLLNIDSSKNAILTVSVVFGITAFIAASTRIFSIWFGTRLSAVIGTDLSTECFKREIYKTYEEHLNSNSSNLLTNNTLFVNRTVDLIQSASRFFIAIISALFISIFLLIFNPLAALLSLLSFAVIYFYLAKILRRNLFMNSQIVANNSQLQIKLMQETLGEIREIILDNKFKKYISLYRKLDRKITISLGDNEVIQLFPRYAIEGLFLILISLITFFMISISLNTLQILPVLGVFAIGAQKLLPNMQQCFSSWTYIKGNYASIYKVKEILDQPFNKLSEVAKSSDKLQFKNNINLIDICYKYSSNSSEIIKNANFKIQKGERIGIVGKTGTGKSTFLDILMGLIYPSKGDIQIDGVSLLDKKYIDRIIEWRSKIAVVPQNIFLADTTIEENIAFGIDVKHINHKKVRRAAQAAMIDEFINIKPLKYESMVGENGVKLSGGQKQRIAIARALYKDSQLIVFDEATSALDLKTEKKIMETIYNLKKDITIIIVTHRIASIEQCDSIYELNNGLIRKIK